MADAVKLTFPATARNREALFEVLHDVLPASGLVLEIASGSGEHAAAFAPRLPALTFQPSDPDATHRSSINAWAIDARAAGGTVNDALDLDVFQPWPLHSADAVVAVNLIHIAPWEATGALFAGAAAVLPSGGPLVLYGPYRRRETPTAPSNDAFDADLKRRNPQWGLRDLEAVCAVADSAGFGGPDVIEMPANNLSVVFRRR